MKNLKKILFTLLAAALVFSVDAANKPVEVVVKNPAVVKSGGEVLVSFDIETSGVPGNYKVTFIPILYNEGTQFTSLPPVSVVGKQMNRKELRAGLDAGDRRVIGRGNSRILKYTASVPFEEWMQYVSVAIHPYVEGCTMQWEEEPLVISEDRLLYYNLIPYFEDKPLSYVLTELEKYDLENPFLHPMEDYEKRYDILTKDRDKGSSTVIFKVSSSVIDTEIQGNREVLDAIAKAFDLIEQDPNAKLKHIFIAGYASPEGSLSLNTRLAKNRAEAVKSYIQSRMRSSNASLFELYNGREDWQGLREAVDNSTMSWKHDVLRIIDSYSMEQEARKGELQRLEGGTPYRFMLENYYPPLRSAGYVQVYYEIDRSATVAQTFTDEHGRTTWINPDSEQNRGITAINKAVELMLQFRFQEALQLMQPYAEDPRSWNNIGVCYMMLDDFDRAESFLVRASNNGDKYAPSNLEQIEWARRIEQ